MALENDTIVAQATPPGFGGVGIVRLSGPQALPLAKTILKKNLKNRIADYAKFYDEDGSIIDVGIVLYFQNPQSFTGEDVVELQGHGGPIVIDRLIQRAIGLGARMARPGEFTERAFLNDKIDLTQAEAIADLIHSTSEHAARSAIRSMEGDFSKTIHQLLEQLIALRLYVEAALDFPEEEIDFISDGKIKKDLNALLAQLEVIAKSAKQGALIRDGLSVVIVGKPNAGKSTLLNALSGRDSAIVTEVPGTTRDVMRENINLDGLPLQFIDTAGLRDSDDLVEQEGIRRAEAEMEKADHILLLTDCCEKLALHEELQVCMSKKEVTHVTNKIDLKQQAATVETHDNITTIALSAKTGDGIDLLRNHLKHIAGYKQANEGNIIARRRHLEALEKTNHHLLCGLTQLNTHQAGELLAEDLRQAQFSLSEITGAFTSDDLLGKIFSSFCIGK